MTTPALNPDHFRAFDRDFKPIAITRDNVEALLDAGQIEAGMHNGAWWRIRRNGATRHWKRDATRIYIPVKAGLRACGAITETDFH